MSTETKPIRRTRALAGQGSHLANQSSAPIAPGPDEHTEAQAEVPVIPPEEGLDLAALFERWNAEDRAGDPEEQQRAFDRLMRNLDEDRQ